MEPVDPAESVPESYHRWYYESGVWKTVSFLGVRCEKSVSDLWNYQEILFERRPELVVEFGTRFGGSALYLASMLALIQPVSGLLLTVDINPDMIDARVRTEPRIECLTMSSASPEVALRIEALRHQSRAWPREAFFILDSNHEKAHVLAELELIREITRSGDYVVVEDGNINGHPVLPDWGEGPWEALEEYFRLHPEDYVRDTAREHKFGWTFAPRGFLIRR